MSVTGEDTFKQDGKFTDSSYDMHKQEISVSCDKRTIIQDIEKTNICTKANLLFIITDIFNNDRLIGLGASVINIDH